MNRVDTIFAERRAAGQKSLAPFIVAGRPSVRALGDTLRAVEGAGASIVEVGFPFSDPIADGPVIAESMHHALENGATTSGVFEALREARESVSLGIVAMVSVSIVQRLGSHAFIERAKDAGVDGFIFPDLPVEESPELLSMVRGSGLSASLLIAPTTPMARAERIARASSGFVYMIARTGITGERDDAPEIGQRVAQLRGVTDLPIACGFGISTADQVRAVVEHADAAIVGSALVRRMETAIDAGGDAVKVAGEFVGELAGGL